MSGIAHDPSVMPGATAAAAPARAHRSWTVYLLVGAVFVAILGLVLAFGLHDSQVAAFVMIGLAAALAPVIGMGLLAWAIDTDVNSGH